MTPPGYQVEKFDYVSISWASPLFSVTDPGAFQQFFQSDTVPVPNDLAKGTETPVIWKRY